MRQILLQLSLVILYIFTKENRGKQEFFGLSFSRMNTCFFWGEGVQKNRWNYEIFLNMAQSIKSEFLPLGFCFYRLKILIWEYFTPVFVFCFVSQCKIFKIEINKNIIHSQRKSHLVLVCPSAVGFVFGWVNP